jgi:PAS domain S-box-containing protein
MPEKKIHTCSAPNRPALKIVSIYLLLGCSWKLITDLLVYLVSGPRELSLLLETLKGWLFIGITAALLYYLINKYVTQLIDAHQKVMDSELKYRTVIETTGTGYVATNPEGRVFDANQEYVRLSGHTSLEEIKGRAVTEWTADYDIARNDAEVAKCFRDGAVRNLEVDYQGRDRVIHPIEINATVLTTSAGSQIITLCRDISARKQILDDLRTRKERLRMALKASHMGVWEWDLRTDRVDWSPEVYDIVGLKDFDGMFASFGRLLHPDDSSRVVATLQQAITNRTEYADEFRIIHPLSGEIRWLANLGQARFATDGTPVIMLGTVRDITARKNAEEATRRYANRLIELDEELRRKLAAELHDEIGRDLTALGLTLTILRGMMPEELQEKLTPRFDDAQVILESTSRSIRGLLSKLRPPVLDDYGLASALRWHCDLFSRRSGLAVDLEIADNVPRFTTEKELALFRIAQEALSNASKHARATTVCVSLQLLDTTVQLSISDNGSGFDPVRSACRQENSHWGLTLMRERAESIKGHFAIDTAPGRGTTIKVLLKEEPGCRSES